MGYIEKKGADVAKSYKTAKGNETVVRGRKLDKTL